MERQRRWGSALLDLLGLGAVGLGTYKLLQGVWIPINSYDEGMLLSHALVLARGGWPHRDFYTIYPPGIYFLILGWWKLFGIGVLAARYLSMGLHAAIVVLAGVAGGWLVQRRFAWLAAGLVTLWSALVGAAPFAWWAGLAAALATVVTLARVTDARGPWFVAGATLALVSAFRHDLAAYFGAGVAALGLIALVRVRPSRAALVRGAGAFVLGAAVPVLVLWVPTLLAAKWSVVYHDLYADQVRYVIPAHRTGLPTMRALRQAGHTSIRLPACLYDFVGMTYLVILAGPLLGVGSILVARAWSLDRGVAALLTTLALAILPQAFRRADWIHAVYAAPPALILAGALPYAPRAPAAVRALGGVLLIVFCAWALRGLYPPTGAVRPQIEERQLDGSPFTRGVIDPYAESRRALRELVDSTLPPGEPIFIGKRSHVRLMVNESDLYFVLDRPCATRYLEFEAGIVPREAVQREIVRDLEARQTRLVVLTSTFEGTEPFNASSVPGSTLLDDYIRAHYGPWRTVGSYEVLLRR